MTVRKTMRLWLILTLLGTYLLVGSGITRAQDIHICYNAGIGTVRIVASTGECISPEGYFTINVSGIAILIDLLGLGGEAGPQGEQGPPGPPGPAGPQGESGMVDIVYLTVTSEFDSDSNKALTVDCPTGYLITGGGAGIIGGFGLVFLVNNQPFGTTSWYARGTEVNTDFAGSWSLRAYAICAQLAS